MNVLSVTFAIAAVGAICVGALIGGMIDRLRWRVQHLERRADTHIETISVQQAHLESLSRHLWRLESVRPPELVGVDRDPPPRWRP